MLSSTIEYVKDDTIDIPMDVLENGSPMDLTGYHIFFTVKKYIADSDEDAQIKLECEIIDPVNGKVSVPFESNPTANMTSGTYYYDFRFKLGAVKMSSFKGKFELLDNVLNAIP